MPTKSPITTLPAITCEDPVIHYYASPNINIDANVFLCHNDSVFDPTSYFQEILYTLGHHEVILNRHMELLYRVLGKLGDPVSAADSSALVASRKLREMINSVQEGSDLMHSSGSAEIDSMLDQVIDRRKSVSGSGKHEALPLLATEAV